MGKFSACLLIGLAVAVVIVSIATHAIRVPSDATGQSNQAALEPTPSEQLDAQAAEPIVFDERFMSMLAEMGAPMPAGYEVAGKQQPLDLAYLPSDAELVVSLRFGEQWNSPLFEGVTALFSKLPQALDESAASVGLVASDLESVTIGIAGLSKAFETPETDETTTDDDEPDLLEGLNAIAAVRTKKPFDLKELRIGEETLEAAAYAGATYYLLPKSPNDLPRLAAFAPTANILLIGPEASIKLAIDGKETPPASRPELAFVNANADLALAIAPQSISAWFDTLAAEADENSQPQSETRTLLQNSLQGVALTLRCAKTPVIEATLNCQDDAAARKVHDLLVRHVDDWRNEWTKPTDGMIELVPPESVQIGISGKTVRVTGEIPESVQQELSDLAANPLMIGLLLNAIGLDDLSDLGFKPSGFEAEPEGEPKGPVSTEGLPEGLTLQARTRWSHMNCYVDGKPQPPALEIVIELSGKPAASAAMQGLYWVDACTTDAGFALQPTHHGIENPFVSFDRIERNQFHVSYDHRVTEDAIDSVFVFKHPEQQTAAVSKFAGSLKLRIPRESKTITIPNVASLAGKLVEHPEFEQAHLRFQIMQARDNPPFPPGDEGGVAVARTVVTLKLLAGDFTLVGEIKPIGRNGQPPEGFSTCSNWQSLQQITWGFDNEFAEGMSLQITIFSGFDEVTVPFEFADLSVVPEPKRNSVMTWGPPPPPAGATRDFTSDDAPPRHGVVFGDSFEDALKQAEGDGRRVLLYCSGDFCTYCRKMERETLTDPDVMASAAKTVSVKLDATRQNPLSEKYEVKVLPTTLVLTADGTVIDRCQGYQSAPEFREWLDAALAKSAIATDESAEKPAATSKTR